MAKDPKRVAAGKKSAATLKKKDPDHFHKMGKVAAASRTTHYRHFEELKKQGRTEELREISIEGGSRKRPKKDA